MKTNFKKMALAAATTAAMAGSMSAHAVIMGVPGEAVLVPYVAAANSSADIGVGSYTYMDTVIRFSVPGSIGTDTVINNFTAPHLTPSVYEFQTQPGLAAGFSNQIFWVFFDNQSNHVFNGAFAVSPDDVAVVSAQSIGVGVGTAPNYGYLVAVTDAAATGLAAADFGFSADAFLTLGSSAASIGDVINIPVLPMADGADNVGDTPSLSNNVIERGNQSWLVSPIASGIRTSGINPLRVVDIALANTSSPVLANLVVLWNDENAGSANLPASNLWDSNENRCSLTMSMPYEVNTYLIASASASLSSSALVLGSNPVEPLLCTNFTPVATPVQLDGQAGSGKLELMIPSPVATSAAGATSSMFAFSLPLTVASGAISDVYSTVILPQDRGSFSQ